MYTYTEEELTRIKVISEWKAKLETNIKYNRLIQLSFNAGALHTVDKLMELNPLFRMSLVEVLSGLQQEYNKVELELYELLKNNPS